MDKARFTNPTGDLVEINKPPKDWSFVPREFPPPWPFSDRLWRLVVDAKEAMGTLNGIGQSLPNPELLLRPLQTREAITSSKLEGTFVTPEQLLLYELDPKEPRAGDEETADWREVFNYSQALKQGCELLISLPMCNRVIREMHSVLMKGVRGRDKTPGQFRKGHVQIGRHVARFVPPPGSEVQRLTENLEKYINDGDHRYDPLVRAYLVHYQFETIHPFLDGNGRVGRALLALMIYKWLGHSHPWLYMSAYFDRYDDQYISRLFNVSARGEWEQWIEFCLRGTIAQANDSIRRCHEFKKLRLQFLDRVKGNETSRTYKLIDDLFTSPVVTIPAVKVKHDVSYPTAQDDIKRLMEAGILIELQDIRPKSFVSPEIIQIAHGEPEWPEESQPEPAPVIVTASHPTPLTIQTNTPQVFVMGTVPREAGGGVTVDPPPAE